MTLLPHWLSFKKNILDQFKPTFDLRTVYDQSMAKYEYIDWLLFQTLPITTETNRITSLLRISGMMDAQSSYSQYRVMLEEEYAVMSFERTGCRVIRPSRALVEPLLNTDVTFPLTAIRPPHPHVFIEIPKGVDLFIPQYRVDGIECTSAKSRVEGIYVTWTEVGPATREQAEHMKKSGAVRDLGGCVVPKDLYKGEGGEAVEITDEMIGDWFARFLLVARDDNRKDTHNWTVHYFNMHWASTNTQDAEGAFLRFKAAWEATKGKLGGDQVDDASRQQFFHLAANLFLYMSMPKNEADVEFVPSPDRARLNNPNLNSKRRRNIRAQLANEMPTEDYLVGQHIVIDRSSEPVNNDPGNSGERSSPRTHWRRGHWRGVWVGSEEKKHMEPRYIWPCLVKGVGTPSAQTVYEVK